MTAIFGTVRNDGGGPAQDLQRLSDALHRYGPDSVRHYTDRQAALGRRLWNLLPEDGQPDSIGHGPKRYVVVADVRLTEREDLAARLDIRDAAVFSDSALVTEAVERWHEDAFANIYGSFAIAAWDTQRQRLLLARDNFGYRPLLYHANADRIVFASMPQGLYALPDVPRGPDSDTMQRYLRLLQPAGEQTPFRDIRRVRPGHLAVIDGGDVIQHRYWTPDLSEQKLPCHAAYQVELSRLFQAAVRSTLRGVSGTVGSHLSSGYDSTAVAVTAARLLAERGGDVVAFTAVPRNGYERSANVSGLEDEGAIAAATAKLHPNMQHVTVQPLTRLDDYLESVIANYGIPVLNMCNAAWIEAINKEAQDRGITVLLEGSMGNATISETGMIAFSELLRVGRLGTWLRVFAGSVRRRGGDVTRLLWYAVAPFLPDRLWHSLRSAAGQYSLPASRASALKASHWAATTDESRRENACLHPLDRSYNDEFGRDMKSGLDERTMIMGSDNGIYLKAVLAHWGLDVRDPTGDRRLAEFSLRVPVEHLIWKGEPRAMLRAFLRGQVAPEMLANRRPGRQGADWAHGMPGTSEALLAQIERIELFDPTNDLIDVARLRDLAEKWPTVLSEGRTAEVGAVADYRLSMVRALTAAAFMRKAAGSNA